ncbi:MAG: rhomboid family intramembrane serine protease [Candidatus Aenigmarchaeota archaeon]|nr:rhomboid family intramembrane serine protease [Candidatus Aenigmarchaeota archaeon]
MKYRWFAFQLVALCVIVFFLKYSDFILIDEYVLVSADVLAKPWTLVTSIFLHGSFEHLFYNMFALGLFGSLLEKIIGSKKFLLLFFVSGIVSGIGSVFFYDAAIGASGAIFGVLGALGALRPKMTVYVSYIPMPMAVAVILWAAGDLMGLFMPSNVANAAHLFGLAFGLLVGLFLRNKYAENMSKRRMLPYVSEERFEEWEDDYM